jgi:hypothetical protein
MSRASAATLPLYRNVEIDMNTQRWIPLVIVAALATLTGCRDQESPTGPPVELPAFAVFDIGCDVDPAARVTTLVEAIRASEESAGPNVIRLAPGCTYTLTLAHDPPDNGLPLISIPVTFEGNGATIERSAAAAKFRIMEVFGPDVIISDLTISNGDARFGGGIFLHDGSLTLIRSTVSGNTAGSGGGIDNFDGQLTIIESTISGNTSTGGGGGISMASFTTTIVNSTISGNNAGEDGGGIENRMGSLRVMHSTITGNRAADGGGVWSTNDVNARVEVKGGIIWGNTTDGVTPNDVAAEETIHRYQSLGNNLIGAAGANIDFTQEFNAPGDLIRVADARLAPLALNAPGTTRTHALYTGSPAIDAGTCTDHAGATITTDQRGAVRPHGAACDIGAYEGEETPPDDTPPIITPDITGTLGQNGWYTSDVIVRWSVVDDESGISSQTGCDDMTIAVDTDGMTLMCAATSVGGSTSESVTIKRDATAPTLDPSVDPNPVLLNGNATATPNASDNLSGVALADCDAPDTGSAGSKSLTCASTDAAGNSAMAVVNYDVHYDFGGFLDPLDGDAVNVVRAGRVVPLVWRLLDANGLPVIDLASVSVSVMTRQCGPDDPAESLPDESVAGKSGLQNLGNGDYQYNWKTPKRYAGSCATLHLDLGEGATRTVDFHFTN